MSKLCPVCGSQLPDIAKFCPDCGEKIPVSAPIPPPQQKKDYDDPALALLSMMINDSSENNLNKIDVLPEEICEESHNENTILKNISPELINLNVSDIPVSKIPTDEISVSTINDVHNDTNINDEEQAAASTEKTLSEDDHENNLTQKISRSRINKGNPDDKLNCREKQSSRPALKERKTREITPDANGIVRPPIFGKSSKRKKDEPMEPRRRGEFKLRDETVQKALYSDDKKSIYEKKLEINKFEDDYDGYYENVIPDDINNSDIPTGKINSKIILTFIILGIVIIGCVVGIVAVMTTL